MWPALLLLRLVAGAGPAGWQVVARAEALGRLPVAEYRSLGSGLSLVVAGVEGPLLEGRLLLATEAKDDLGLPHVLEHLVFQGSARLPYPGLHSLVAACASSRLNALTAPDHTVYILTSTSKPCFLHLLPVLLEHVLRPALPEAAFLTEVHHVDGSGRDAGVVYSELQGREGGPGDVLHWAMVEALYPPASGCRARYGGTLAALRNRTTLAAVRDYHDRFYRPENIRIIVTGQVKAEEVIRELEGVEQGIAKREPFVRPGQGRDEALSRSKVVEVPFPAAGESSSTVYIAWRLITPTPMFAINVLASYLCDSPASLLQATFVHAARPLAGLVKVMFMAPAQAESTFYFSFDGVPLARRTEVGRSLKEALEALAGGGEPWDRAMLGAAVRRWALECRSQAETGPHQAVAAAVTRHFLHGRLEGDLRDWLNPEEQYMELLDKPDSFWVGLVRDLLVDSPSVEVRGVPSRRLQRERREREERRVARQREVLGREGLRRRGEQLVAATRRAATGRPPLDLISSLPDPGHDSIAFYNITSVTSNSGTQLDQFDLRQMPVYFEFDQINSNFVYLFMMVKTGSVPARLKLHLPLLLHLLTASPVVMDGQEMPFQVAIAQRARDCLKASFELTAVGDSAELYIQAEPSKYPQAVAWLHRLLFRTKITAERSLAVAARMESQADGRGRVASHLVTDMMKSQVYSNRSNAHVTNTIRQQEFLHTVRSRLQSSPEEVLQELEELRGLLTRPTNLWVHMAADLSRLAAPLAPWAGLLPPAPGPIQPPGPRPGHPDTLAPPRHVALALPACQTTFLHLSAPTGRHHPGLAPLLVAVRYLAEPLQRAVRGGGLAYTVRLWVGLHSGQVYLALDRAARPLAAYQRAAELVRHYARGEEAWDGALVTAAKGATAAGLLEGELSLLGAVTSSLLRSLTGVTREEEQGLVAAVGRVTGRDLALAAASRLAPLFQAERSRTSLVAGPGAIGRIRRGFAALGVNITMLPSGGGGW
jgi:Zn-dependent M16 (insulinase) family peptidase